MKVISIKEPYASLIANGYKEYEFRTWKTNYRGEIYIHASLGVDKKAMEKYKDLNLKYQNGSIIAVCRLNDCIEINDKFKTTLSKKNKYPYIYQNVLDGNDDKYAFEIKNVKKINPIKVKGKLGLWNLDIEKSI